MGPATGSPAPPRYTRELEPGEPEAPDAGRGVAEGAPRVLRRLPRPPDAAARRAQLEAEAAAELQRATGSQAQSWRDLGAVQRPPSRFTRRVEPEEPEEPEEPAVEQRPTAARSSMRPQARPQTAPPLPPRSAAARQVEAEYDEDDPDGEYDDEYDDEYGEYDDEPIPLLGVASDFDATGVALRQLAERSSSVRPEDIVMRIDAVEAQATRDRAMADFLERQARQREAMQRAGAGTPVKRAAPAMPAMPVTPGLVARARPSSPAPALPAQLARAGPPKAAHATPPPAVKAPPARAVKATAAKAVKVPPARAVKATASKAAKAPPAKAPPAKVVKATASKAASASRAAVGKPAGPAVAKPAKPAKPGPAARTPRSSASTPETSSEAPSNGPRQGPSKRPPRRPAAGG